MSEFLELDLEEERAARLVAEERVRDLSGLVRGAESILRDAMGCDSDEAARLRLVADALRAALGEPWR